MNKPFGNADPKLSDYVTRLYAPEDAVLAEIRERSAAAGLPDIQVAALDALHLEVIARAAGARRAVEIGTLGGYSGVALLRGMGAGRASSTPSRCRRATPRSRARASAARASAARVRVHVGAAPTCCRRLRRARPVRSRCSSTPTRKATPPTSTGRPTTCARAASCCSTTPSCSATCPTRRPAIAPTQIRAMQSVHETLARGGQFRATVLPTGEGLAFGVRV